MCRDRAGHWQFCELSASYGTKPGQSPLPPCSGVYTLWHYSLTSPRFQQIGDGDGGASPIPDKSGTGTRAGGGASESPGPPPVHTPGKSGTDAPSPSPDKVIGDGDGDGDRGVRALLDTTTGSLSEATSSTIKVLTRGGIPAAAAGIRVRVG